MLKMNKYISIIVVLIMICTAAITVNKSLFGHSLETKQTDSAVTETEPPITFESDGGIIIHTADVDGTIDGYAGSVPLDIYISGGKISDIKALPNSETPSFFSRAAEIIPLWIGKTPGEAEEMKVDAISGATFSSTAIINNVNAGLAYYDGMATQEKPGIPVKIWIALAVTLAACIIPLFVKNKIYHTVQLLANIIVLGFWSGQFLDYSLILKYTSHGFTWPAAIVAIVMLIAAFVYPIFGKPQHYCTHICPFGSAQQIVGQLFSHKIKISVKVLKGLDWFRKILWAFLMLLLWADCLTGWMDLELFQAFQFQSASLGIIIAASLFIILSTVINRPFCRFICPTGSLLKRYENIG